MFGVGTGCPYGWTNRPVSCEWTRTMLGRGRQRCAHSRSSECTLFRVIPAPDRSYFVCATPRSGSTVLCKSLAATGVAGRPDEYFERLQALRPPARAARVLRGYRGPRPARPAAPHAHRRSRRRRARPRAPALPRRRAPRRTACSAAKLMWGYFADLLARLGTTPDGSRRRGARRALRRAVLGPRHPCRQGRPGRLALARPADARLERRRRPRGAPRVRRAGHRATCATSCSGRMPRGAPGSTPRGSSRYVVRVRALRR